ncbi:UNVERIFIED_CONTAM: hypothetical protein K2H54_029122 [Gekko kuhli]
MPKLPLSPVPEQENDVGSQWPGSSSSFDVSQSDSSSSSSSSPDSAVGGKASPQYVAEPQEGKNCHEEKAKDDLEEEEREEETKEDVESEEEWDTDLETEGRLMLACIGFSDWNRDSKKVYDPTGKAKYLEICQAHGVTPASYFMRHMKDSELSLMHHGLGPKPRGCAAGAGVCVVGGPRGKWLGKWVGTPGSALGRIPDLSPLLGRRVALAGCLCTVEDIDLSENRLGIKGAKALSAVLQENTTLVTLKLSGNELNDQAAKYLAGALLTNNKLESLDLSHNAFGESAGEVLGATIAENAGMKELNLSWNCFRGQGAVAVAKGLGANIFLQVLDLSYNGFGNKGAAALGEALKINNVLEELNVGNNRISLEGALCLALGLKENKTLRCLSEIVLKQDFAGLCNAVQETFPGLQIKHDGTRPSFRTSQSKM